MHIYHEYQESCQNVPSTLPTEVLHLARSLRDPSIISLPEGDEIGLANGLAGLALLPLTLASVCSQQERQAWLDVASAYFTQIAHFTHEHPLTHPGLYHGSCGVAFSLSLLAQYDERYLSACRLLLTRLVNQIVSWNWYTSAFLSGQENFEVIGGAAGLLRFLLTQAHEADVQPALASLVSYLTWVSEARDRWHHHPERLGKVAKAHYPDGYIDLGMAHGLSGPLAVLSLAARAGYASPRVLGAIERWASWFLEQQIATDWGLDWPSVIPRGQCARDCLPARAAWCYGTPGIARALWLAGNALEDDSLRALAREALASTLRRPQQKSDEPHICHGLAGLLLICLRFADDDPVSASWLEGVISSLTTTLYIRWSNVSALMPPRFLTGSIGGALTLIAAFTKHPPCWDQTPVIS
jgi:Lanthionine synthetase C-like protein.